MEHYHFLAATLLRLELLRQTLRFILLVYSLRPVPRFFAALLGKPYSTWRHDVENYLPSIDQMYEEEIAKVKPNTELAKACEHVFRELILTQRSHLQLDDNAQRKDKPLWLIYGPKRRELLDAGKSVE